MKEKLLPLFVFLFYFINCNAQIVIPTDVYDFIHVKNKEKQVVSIIKDDNSYVYYKLTEDAEVKNKVNKRLLVDWHKADYWDINFRRDLKNNISYTEVVESKTDSIELMFYTARLWLGEYFKTTEHYIDIEDIFNGLIVATGYRKLYDKKLWMTIKVEIKANRFRYTINNLAIQHPFDDYGNAPKFAAEKYFHKSQLKRKQKKKEKTKTLKGLRHLINDLKITMKNSIEQYADW